MSLPYVIESLLTIRRASSGGSLVHQGGSQTVINQLPPYTQIVLNVFPFGNDYFDIIYSSYIDPSVVPGVFFGYGQYFGSRTYDGVITSGFMTYTLESLVFISESEPAQALIRNDTPLYQYYAGAVFYVAIATEEDFNIVLEYLKGVGNKETNRLLDLLVAQQPVGAT